jgi:hypothetical protein
LAVSCCCPSQAARRSFRAGHLRRAELVGRRVRRISDRLLAGRGVAMTSTSVPGVSRAAVASPRARPPPTISSGRPIRASIRVVGLREVRRR